MRQCYVTLREGEIGWKCSSEKRLNLDLVPVLWNHYFTSTEGLRVVNKLDLGGPPGNEPLPSSFPRGPARSTARMPVLLVRHLPTQDVPYYPVSKDTSGSPSSGSTEFQEHLSMEFRKGGIMRLFSSTDTSCYSNARVSEEKTIVLLLMFFLIAVPHHS